MTGEGARGDALNQKQLLDHLKSCGWWIKAPSSKSVYAKLGLKSWSRHITMMSLYGCPMSSEENLAYQPVLIAVPTAKWESMASVQTILVDGLYP
jgi:hypothetical protein